MSSNTFLAEWTGLEPATPGVTGRCQFRGLARPSGRFVFQKVVRFTQISPVSGNSDSKKPRRRGASRPIAPRPIVELQAARLTARKRSAAATLGTSKSLGSTSKVESASNCSSRCRRPSRRSPMTQSRRSRRLQSRRHRTRSSLPHRRATFRRSWWPQAWSSSSRSFRPPSLVAGDHLDGHRSMEACGTPYPQASRHDHRATCRQWRSELP